MSLFARVLAVVIGGLSLAACSGGPDVSRLRIEQGGWDTLYVALDFEHAGRARDTAGLIPDSIRILIFDSRYDTVFVGQDTLVILPDEALANADALLLEGCGWFGGRAVCDQSGFSASPKRVTAEFEPVFPVENEYERTSLTLRPQLERLRWGGEEWEILPKAPIPPIEMHLRVLDSEDPGMTVPVKAGAQRIRLDEAGGFRDFRFFLRSRFRDTGEARVQFQLVAAFANGPVEVAEKELLLAFKSESEQLEELGTVVESVGKAVLRAMGDGSGNDRSYVFVNDWDYDVARRTYSAEIEVHWREGRFRRWQELVLTFSAPGSAEAVTVRKIRANDRGEDRWRSRASGDTLRVSVQRNDRGLRSGESGGESPSSGSRPR